MGNINQYVAENITKLRKANKLTQSQLADKLNYSDKAVSKWERGDSTPDIEMLCEIAKLFGVNVDYLTKPHTDIEIKNSKDKTQLFIRRLLILIMVCIGVMLIATSIFVVCTLKNPALAKTSWVSFIAATPVCALICALYAKKEGYWLMELICFSLVIWTVITTAYCFTLINNLSNFWLLFIAAVPIQIAIGLYLFLKKPE